MIHQLSNSTFSVICRACCAVLLVIAMGNWRNIRAEDLFAPPEPVETPAPIAPETGKSTPPVSNEFHPLPPVGNIAGHRSSLIPRWTYSPLQSPLFLDFPAVTRPLVGPPLLFHGPQCQPSPGFMPPPASPGFMRSLTRYGITSPIAPAVVSAHAPPWERLPPPAQLHGGILSVGKQCHDPRSCEAQFNSGDFTPDPYYGQFGWNPAGELAIYGGKYMNPIQRPAIEWGLPFYETGPLPRSGTALGCTNLTQQKFYVYGDYRSAMAYNQNVANEQTIWANRLNLEFDWAFTATERVHMFMGPLDERNQFSSLVYDNGKITHEEHWDAWDPRTDTLFFEGDLGYMLGGLTDKYASFNLPIAVGLMPLLFQNGIWMEDAFLGIAATIPARNNPVLDWSNFDTTLFVGFDEITSNIAFQGDNRAANMVGLNTFIESKGGYAEIGYAFLDDTRNLGRSYHNLGMSYTRRYANLVSNSLRMIVNAGQDLPRDDRTADGVLLLMENSFLTRNQYNVIPYANFFAGFGRPQSVARLQGPLKNTGINFESDLLTGYPTLDATGNNTFGGAVGIDLLGNCFEQQLILEAATVQVMNSPANRVAVGDEYAVGMRFQKPLSHTLILRTDAMYGVFENSPDIAGARMELRRKF